MERLHILEETRQVVWVVEGPADETYCEPTASCDRNPI
jgi:hypothetical protein